MRYALRMTYPRFASRFFGLRFASVASLSLTVCAACGGSSFDSGGSAGASSGGTGASGATGGGTSTAGTSSGGASAGSTAGGGTSTAGTTSTGGTSAGGTSSGGTTSTAGASSGGSSGAADCASLKADYEATVQKARGCDQGSMDECSTSSTMPTLGCGCPTLVNAKSPYTDSAKKKYQAIQDAKCPAGPLCNIACLPVTSASCSVQMTSAGSDYLCTGSMGVTTN